MGRDINQFRLLTAAVLLCACVLGSCSQGPAPVRPGTPAFFWAAADAAWRAGDYSKTNESLSQLATGDSEFAARARVWQLIVASGLAEGYTDLADAYESGARSNRNDAAGFREQVRLARSAASQLSLQAAETLRKFLDTDKNANVGFAFAFPQAEAPAPALLAKLNKGILLKGAEADSLEKAMLHRGVSQAAARAAGIKPDAADAAEAFKKEIPREQFLVASASSMVEQSRLFGPKKLDQPQRLMALCGLAQEALTLAPPSAKTKELQVKIKAALGKRKAS
jgi:hypothetical protein